MQTYNLNGLVSICNRDSLIGAWHGMIDGYLLKLEAKTLGSASKQIGPWGDMAMFNSYVKLPECT